jgi:hypothetical protein
MRDINKIQEFLDLIQLAPKDNLGQIWQTQEPLRQVYKITSLKNDTKRKALIIETVLNFDFIENIPVFVRINNRDLIFKLDMNTCLMEKNKIICHYPELSKAIEDRAQARIGVPPNKVIMTRIQIKGKVTREFLVLLKDFSRQGIGIYTPDFSEEAFNKTNVFELISIGSVVLPKIKLDMRYSRPLPGTRVQVGFQLMSPFADVEMQHLTNLVLD